jgi:leukotriene-A4 hydrolase
MHRAPHAMVTRPLADGITVNTPRDPNTLSNYNNFITTHTTANFTIDFDGKKLAGNVVLKLKSITNAESNQIILDTRYVQNYVTCSSRLGLSSTFGRLSS